METRKVIVYSTPLCAPCERLKDHLKSQGINYTVRDLMMDEDAAELLASHNIRTSPALQVGEVIISGKDLNPHRIAELLGI
jgi:glutaredoxin